MAFAGRKSDRMAAFAPQGKASLQTERHGEFEFRGDGVVLHLDRFEFPGPCVIHRTGWNSGGLEMALASMTLPFARMMTLTLSSPWRLSAFAGCPPTPRRRRALLRGLAGRGPGGNRRRPCATAPSAGSAGSRFGPGVAGRCGSDGRMGVADMGPPGIWSQHTNRFVLSLAGLISMPGRAASHPGGSC